MSHRIRCVAGSAATAQDRADRHDRAAGCATARPGDAGTRWDTWTKQA